jgi:hypothetical protein
MDCSSTTKLIEGDTFKIRVTDQAGWDTWLAAVVGQTQLAASAHAVAQIVGNHNPYPSAPTWPLVRRRPKVDPTAQGSTKTFIFWSSDIVHSADQAGSSWKGVVQLGRNSIGNSNNETQGYSTTSHVRNQTIESARYSSDPAWGNFDDWSCTTGSGPYDCGTTWSGIANNGRGDYLYNDYPRDPQNWFHYGFKGKLNLQNDWSVGNPAGLTCGTSAGYTDCGGIPNAATFNRANGYELINQNGNASWWHANGDWVEVYGGGSFGGGNVGNNIFQEILWVIQNAPDSSASCPLSDKWYDAQHHIKYGRCVKRAVYLWEGAQVYTGGTPPWAPWDGHGSTPPDRVHLVEWWYFDFYEGPVMAGGNSNIEGQFDSLGTQGYPGGGGGAPGPWDNYYFLVGD